MEGSAAAKEEQALLLVGLNHSGGSLWDTAVPYPDHEVKAILGQALESISRAAEGDGLDEAAIAERLKRCVTATAGASGVVLLHVAARCGWLTCVHMLLHELGADIDARSAHGCSALIMAAEEGHLGVVQELANLSADVNVETTGSGTTALHQASRYGHEDVVSVLLSHGADPTKRLRDGRTPLYLSAHAGYESIIQLLLDHIGEGRAEGEARAAVLKQYVDLPREEGEDEGTTPLMQAATYGHTEALQLLIESRASVDLQSADGDTALLLACADGHEQPAKMLLQANALMDQRGANGQTVLMTACRYGHLSLVRLLLALGAKADDTDHSGTDALSHLCEYEQEDDDEMLALLLNAKQHAPKIDAVRSSDGSTPLHIAADTEHDEATRQLLKAKADPNRARKVDGFTPMMIACSNGYESIMHLLMEDERVEVNAKALDGRTSLHCASEHGQAKLIGRLLAAKANPAAKTAKGETPLALAMKGDSAAHKQIVVRLQEEAEGRRGKKGRRGRASVATPVKQ